MQSTARKPWAVVLSSDAVGLGAVRSLQAGGVPTIVVMMDPWEPVRASRYGQKILVPKSHDVDAAILDVLAGRGSWSIPASTSKIAASTSCSTRHGTPDCYKGPRSRSRG